MHSLLDLAPSALQKGQACTTRDQWVRMSPRHVGPQTWTRTHHSVPAASLPGGCNWMRVGGVWSPGQTPPGQQWGRNGGDTHSPALRPTDPARIGQASDGIWQPLKGVFSYHSLNPPPACSDPTLTREMGGGTFAGSASSSPQPLGWHRGRVSVSS